MPDNRIQVVKAYSPAGNANIGVKRKDKMPSKITPRYTDITDYTNKTAPRNENPKYVPPDL
jgi:hypothetical protein